ncbi:MAG: hypothetical protein JRI68_04645 [Deltaproteobacteria bacterium]|nr:hypothetical protein [Deltaproteobacteria bacterium]
MSRSDDTTSQSGSPSTQGVADSSGAGAAAGSGAGDEGLAAVVAERDALRAELADAQELADADMKALGEDSDRYIAELIAEHDAERARVQEQVQRLEARVEALQETVDEHAIERYELVQQRDAAQRAVEEAGTDWAQSGQPAPAESAALSELAAELAEVRQVVAQTTADRDELLLAVEATKADSVVEQDRLVAELVESHHEEVASLSGELDSVSTAVLETEQDLDAARADVATLEQQVAALSQPPAEEEAPAAVGPELERQLMEAEAELQRARGENVVLHQLVEEARSDSGAPLAEPHRLGSPTPPQSHVRELEAEAEVQLHPPGDDLRPTMPSIDDGPVALETPELAVEEWGSEAPRADEPVQAPPSALTEPGYASLPLDVPVEAPPAAAVGAGAPEWEHEAPSGGSPGPGRAPGVPPWELDGARMSSEVTTEPPSSGDGPSIALADPSDPAPDCQTPPPEEDPSEWQLDDVEPEAELEVAAPVPDVDLRDQTPTVPPRRPAREQQETVPSGGDESDGTYSFVAPRKRRKKPPG